VTSEYPPQVRRWHNALLSVPGVLRVDTSITSLQEVTPDVLAQPDLADLPHGVVTRGVLEGEAVVQSEFELERSEVGWLALEFIAWSVKDLARSGQPVQLRPVGLPPIVRDRVQLGHTLKFLIDVFVTLEDDVRPALAKLEELAGYVEKYVQLYAAALQKS
jgi:hypothetical protein